MRRIWICSMLAGCAVDGVGYPATEADGAWFSDEPVFEEAELVCNVEDLEPNDSDGQWWEYNNLGVIHAGRAAVLCGTAEPGDDDDNLFELLEPAELEFTLTWTASAADLDLYTYRWDTEVWDGSATTSHPETHAQHFPAGTWSVVVDAYAGPESAYTLTVRVL